MEKILNLTQHVVSREQTAAGVVEPINKAIVREILTFKELPGSWEIQRRAGSLASIAQAENVTVAMIGGALWLMSSLERELLDRGITPLYAFSVREREEIVQEDGSMKKVSTFRHKGFVKPLRCH